MAQKTVGERFADKKVAERQIGTFEVRKIVREFVPIVADPHAHKTFGGMLDDILMDCATESQEVQSIGFEIAEDAWREFDAEVNRNRSDRSIRPFGDED